MQRRFFRGALLSLCVCIATAISCKGEPPPAPAKVDCAVIDNSVTTLEDALQELTDQCTAGVVPEADSCGIGYKIGCTDQLDQVRTSFAWLKALKDQKGDCAVSAP